MRRVLAIVLLALLVSCATRPLPPPACEDHLLPINATSTTGEPHEARPSR
jgi:hypothetical protein